MIFARANMCLHTSIQNFHGFVVISAWNGEREVRFTLNRLILNNHVNFDIRIGHCLKFGKQYRFVWRKTQSVLLRHD